MSRTTEESVGRQRHTAPGEQDETRAAGRSGCSEREKSVVFVIFPGLRNPRRQHFARSIISAAGAIITLPAKRRICGLVLLARASWA